MMDLFPYFLLVICCFISGFTNYKTKDNSFLIFLFVLVFSAIRYQTGYDYGNYLEAIQLDGSEEKFEIIVRWIIRFSRVTHPQFFFAITSFLTLFPIYKLSKKYSIDPSLSLIAYVFFPVFFLESLSIIRNAVAISMSLLAIDKFLEKSYWTASLFYICAIGFHLSAIIGILFILLYKFNLSRNALIVCYLLSFIISPIILNFISSIQSEASLFLKISNYAMNGKIGAGATMAILVNIIGVICLIYWKRIEQLTDYNKLWLIYCIVGVICWNSFSFEGTLRLRISSYFLIFFILIIPSFKYIFRRIIPRVMKVILVCCLLLVFVASFYININGHLQDLSKMSVLPYQCVFYKTDYIQYN